MAMTQQQILSIVCKICDAVQFAHERGVLHRDLKAMTNDLSTTWFVKLNVSELVVLYGFDSDLRLYAIRKRR